MIRFRKPSLLVMILLAVVLGVFAGLFFGERCRHLAFLGQAFIAIMQISVLPYILVSLIQSIGSLDLGTARSLAKRGAIMVLVLWGIVFCLMSLMPLCFPRWESASFFSPSLLGGRDTVDYIQLFIPANPFNALANNVVPAVTIFSILCGVVLMGVPQKKNLLNVLETASEVLSRLTLMLVKLSPIGIFALIANAAGTMYPEELGRLEVYLLAFFVMGGLLFFLVLPLLLTAVTPFHYREVMQVSRTAMLTVLLTGNLFIVLPLLVDNVKHLFERHGLNSEESVGMAKIIVPITFILPCAGQLMDLLFILFSAWFQNDAFGLADYFKLYGAGLLTLFGSAKVAIPFLLSMFKLPSDLFALFLVSSVVADNIKYTVEAFAVLSFATLFAAWMTGVMKIRLRRLAGKLVIIAAGTALTLTLTAIVMNHALPQPESPRRTLDAMRLQSRVETQVFERLPEPKTLQMPGNRLERIMRDKVLRVGFNANVMPFAFFNHNRELIGFDIAMAHRLAESLGCRKLEFYPVRFNDLATPLNADLVDIVMSEVSITTARLGQMTFTQHYLELSLALVVPDYVKEKLRDNPELLTRAQLTLAGMEGADFDRLSSNYPFAKLVKIKDYQEFFSGRVKADGLLVTAEKGSAWTIMYPEYDIYVPPRHRKDIVAYAIANGDSRFLEYLNYWLTLERLDGAIEREYEYWIKGVNVRAREQRWSILDNVLLKDGKNPVKSGK